LIGRLFRRSRRSQQPVGIDLGRDAVRVAQVRWDGETPELSLIESHPLQVDPRGSLEDYNQAVDQLLKELVGKKHLPSTKVVTNLWSRASKVRIVHIPPVPDAELADALRSELARTDEIDPQQLAIDFEPVGTVTARGSEKLAALVLSSTKAEVDAHVQRLRGLGLEPVAIDDIALAIARLRRQGQPMEKDETSALLLAGQTSTSIVFLIGGVVQYYREVPFGGREIITDLAKSLQLDEAEVWQRRADLRGAQVAALAGLRPRTSSTTPAVMTAAAAHSNDVTVSPPSQMPRPSAITGFTNV
jgi:type IV pilus assembly protein PilM